MKNKCEMIKIGNWELLISVSLRVFDVHSELILFF